MSITFAHWQFKPSWLVSLITLVLFPLFVSLGLWQLQRAEQVSAIQTIFDHRLEADYQDLLPIINNAQASLKYRKISIQGHYLSQPSFLYDNRLHQGQPGYHVISAFKPTASQRILLVNRGWIAQGNSRDSLPVIDIDSTETVLHGILYHPIASVVLTDKTEQHDLQQRVQRIDISQLQTQFDQSLLPYMIWLAPDQAQGYVRAWQPHYRDPRKNTAYAVQWFSFALILLFLYFKLNTRRLPQPE